MGNFNNLPSDIVLDIITRLPTESVLECKLVCNPWRNLVSHHPLFSQMHLTHLNQSVDSAGKFGYLVRAKNYQLHYFEYNESHDETPIHGTRRINFTPPFRYPYNYQVIGSFNGLVCLYGHGDHPACIFNPVTKEYVVLPKIERDSEDKYFYWASGFGYVPSTNEYKVVQLYNLKAELNVMEVAVYTLGSGNGWRNIGRLDSKTRMYVADLYMNGALYWKEALNKYNGELHLGEKVGRLY
ncbi:F-box/kelch-repeat protein At3g23880-like [Papaver somniferum]|uniref:F-box/kelch-repeat protein At3g23880-like n=1 Tax=Papaver somniferum TaxID=3469 RepID=UPI000E6F6E13|nr:F-box/kelch-repeat protein At3g23880-like [Papaver somniferum]